MHIAKPHPFTHRLFALSLLSAAPLVSAQPAADEAAETAMPQVSIVAERVGDAWNPQQSRGATRTDTPLAEVPQSVRVISLQQIEDLGATRMADTVDFVSGISRLNDFGGTWDNFAIRGFSSTDMGYLVNGFPGSRGYNPPRDTATVERFEFLKGPAGAVYGSSEPGGTINIVTKKPKFDSANVAEASVGSTGLRRATLDSTGALTDTVAYRLNLVTEEGGPRSSLLHNKRTLVAPALTWKIDGRTTFGFESEFLRTDAPLDRGVINVRGVLGTLPRDRVLNEPGDDNMRLNSDTHQATLEHRLTDDWRVRIGASYKESDFYGEYTEATALAADNRTLNRQATWRTLPSRDVALQAELEGKFTTGGIGHTLLVGAEASRLWMNMEILRSANTPIDIYTPVYGKAAPALTSLTTSSDERQRVKAVFAQDQVSLSDRWKLLAGLRWDEYSQSLENRVAKTFIAREQSAVTPRAGVTYLPNGWSSLYVSAGKSFRGNNGTDIAGRAFDPQRSTAYEAGWKLQTPDGRLGATLALYEITKTNVLTASDVPGYSVAAGEIRSTGFEVDVNGQVDRHWRVMGNFAWDDARVTKDKTLAAGTRLANVPEYSAGLLAIREDRLPGGGRYGIGAGANYVGERSGNSADTYSLPAYTTFKLVSYWQVNRRTRLSVDVHNLANRMFYTSSWGNLYVSAGAERSVVARLKVDL
ncbi:TonB-dependent siderophore receptor [Massilia dura]|uniref:TonB-dependent siderophore receptor n=1 Tax=Pseudoduganella dura TaxID=321982 RepID=A0A6I3XJ96_9BURK|nr:TonB-dependent siderophore receptor [Pseudoduganella dura]MUI14610.1 TonB-dependent siderophore receptor [Pseudoduganella dura]GGY12118.1 TonB-dependent receptor [Pseudoduganella dura]